MEIIIRVIDNHGKDLLEISRIVIILEQNNGKCGK